MERVAQSIDYCMQQEIDERIRRCCHLLLTDQFSYVTINSKKIYESNNRCP